MTAKEIRFDEDARKRLQAGVEEHQSALEVLRQGAFGRFDLRLERVVERARELVLLLILEASFLGMLNLRGNIVCAEWPAGIPLATWVQLVGVGLLVAGVLALRRHTA